MSRRGLTYILLLALVAASCSREAKPVNLPPPIEATTIGVGDVLIIYIVGEDKIPTEYKVAPDGTIDVPFIHRVKVSGLEPQQISDLVGSRLEEEQIRTDPSVSVFIKDYNSKKIEVLGQVKQPGSLALEPGMTLLRAISQAGGFNMLSDRSRVRITRKVLGGTKSAKVDVTAIIDNRIPDVPLQAGDVIHVEERVF